jgi:two-component system sensor histidine kinase KdpD
MMDQRPDPDQLLEQIRDDEVKSRRGTLKIFFGACAGVGKTCAMLQAAQAQRQQGTDLLIGVVETHGRAETEALTKGLDRLPLKTVPYRDRTLAEFDLDGALARGPALILMDELAHSNLAGSRHPKRWQDVEELLTLGIDVWSTMNVQHLESLNDIVSGITGIRVWETVPDHVFDQADEVVVVDLPPDELLQRLKEGKVYLPHQAERAAKNFFRKGNLLALRELALRRTADRVDDEMLQYRRRISSAVGGGPAVWATRDSLLVALGEAAAGVHDDKLVRKAARLAAQLDVPWHAVYVETPALQRLPEGRRGRILRSLKLAQDLGATTETLAAGDVAQALLRYAREHNLVRLMLGHRQGRWRLPWRRTVAERIGQLATDLDVVQVALPSDAGEAAARNTGPGVEAAASQRPDWPGYAKAAVFSAGTALLALPLHAVFELVNIVMLLLLAVVGVAMRYGRGPAVLSAFLGVGLFDFLFVPPRFSFAVSDVQYLITFAVMLVVALVIGQTTAGLRYQARVAMQREDRMRSLYEMSRDLSAALLPEQVAEIAGRFLSAQFGARAALYVVEVVPATQEDRLGAPVAAGTLPQTLDSGIAQWAYDRGEPAGHGTDTLPASPALYLPLKAPMRLRGVLAVEPLDAVEATRLLVPEQRRLLDTCASLLAISLERIHYVEVAGSTTLQMESERLRGSLLAAISHDLRTPLQSLVGLAESMAMTQPPLSGEPADIARAMREAALRMNALVSNLLDMARLESGLVQLNRQWQPLEEVVGTAITSLGSALQRHEVHVALADDLPLVHIDAVLIERVLANLLENAAKYTPPGSAIEVGAQALSDVVEVWVADHGPGLPAGKEEALFQKFERGQKESATPGVGLGLAICRAIVQAHGGSITGMTRPQGGARFTFRLPRGTPPALPDVEEVVEARVPSGDRPMYSLDEGHLFHD